MEARTYTRPELSVMTLEGEGRIRHSKYTLVGDGVANWNLEG